TLTNNIVRDEAQETRQRIKARHRIIGGPPLDALPEDGTGVAEDRVARNLDLHRVGRAAPGLALNTGAVDVDEDVIRDMRGPKRRALQDAARGHAPHGAVEVMEIVMAVGIIAAVQPGPERVIASRTAKFAVLDGHRMPVALAPGLRVLPRLRGPVRGKEPERGGKAVGIDPLEPIIATLQVRSFGVGVVNQAVGLQRAPTNKNIFSRVPGPATIGVMEIPGSVEDAGDARHRAAVQQKPA